MVKTSFPATLALAAFCALASTTGIPEVRAAKPTLPPVSVPPPTYPPTSAPVITPSGPPTTSPTTTAPGKDNNSGNGNNASTTTKPPPAPTTTTAPASTTTASPPATTIKPTTTTTANPAASGGAGKGSDSSKAADGGSKGDGEAPTAGNGNGASTSSGKGGTNPLVIKGSRFFDSVTGAYVGFRGINYYPRPNTGALDANNLDLFTDKFKHIWQRDVPEFEALGANAIRLYAVDPDGDHTAFMCALQAAGIYVIVDLASSCAGCEITPDEPPTCYPASYKARGEKIIQNFSKYDNVIAFSGGNEVNHRTGGRGGAWNAPCQKKFVRDMRAYIQSCPEMRQIPMGLVVADTERPELAAYYNCRTDPTDELETAEWYGINVYVHCGDIADPKAAAGFNMLRDSFKSYKYSIPVILTEFGCTSTDFPTVDGYEGQRTFHDAKFMNSAGYSDYFNGGFAFEYSTENANSKSTSAFPFTKSGPQNYGLGYLSPEDCDDVTTKCDFVRFPNFHFLADAYKATDTSKEPTLDKFAIPGDRTKPMACPANFTGPGEYTWEGDSEPSAACPTKRFQCPNVPAALPTKKPREAKDEGVASGGSGSTAAAAATPVGATPSGSSSEMTEAPESPEPTETEDPAPGPTPKKTPKKSNAAADDAETPEPAETDDDADDSTTTSSPPKTKAPKSSTADADANDTVPPNDDGGSGSLPTTPKKSKKATTKENGAERTMLSGLALAAWAAGALAIVVLSV